MFYCNRQNPKNKRKQERRSCIISMNHYFTYQVTLSLQNQTQCSLRGNVRTCEELTRVRPFRSSDSDIISALSRARCSWLQYETNFNLAYKLEMRYFIEETGNFELRQSYQALSLCVKVGPSYQKFLDLPLILPAACSLSCAFFLLLFFQRKWRYGLYECTG